jgi:predicted acyl esterase
VIGEFDVRCNDEPIRILIHILSFKASNRHTSKHMDKLPFLLASRKLIDNTQSAQSLVDSVSIDSIQRILLDPPLTLDHMPEQTTSEVDVVDHAWITMRDGVRLSVRLFLPRNLAVKYPGTEITNK